MSVRDWAPFGQQRTYSADGLDELGFVGLIGSALALMLAAALFWFLFT